MNFRHLVSWKITWDSGLCPDPQVMGGSHIQPFQLKNAAKLSITILLELLLQIVLGEGIPCSCVLGNNGRLVMVSEITNAS